MKNKALLAPLMGAAISLIIFSIYLLTTINISFQNMTTVLLSLFNIIPTLAFIFILISYAICGTIGLIILKIKYTYSLSSNQFWLLSFLVSLLLGSLVAVINYQNEQLIGKAMSIILSFSFGGVFTASLYSVIRKEIKENNHAN